MSARINNNSISTDPLCLVSEFLDDKDWASARRVCHSWNSSIEARPKFINQRLEKGKFKIITDVFGGKKNFAQLPLIPFPRPVREYEGVVIYSPSLSDQLVERFRQMDCPAARAMKDNSVYILARLKNHRNPHGTERIHLWEVQKWNMPGMEEAVFNRYREYSFIFTRNGGILSIPTWGFNMEGDSDCHPRNYPLAVDYLKRLIRREPCGELGCINGYLQGGAEGERTTVVRGVEVSTVTLISRPARSWSKVLMLFFPQIAMLVSGFALAYFAAQMQSNR